MSERRRERVAHDAAVRPGRERCGITHCAQEQRNRRHGDSLYELAEPFDARADIDDNHDASEDSLPEHEQVRCRGRRTRPSQKQRVGDVDLLAPIATIACQRA